MTTSALHPPPGWYPDPSGARQWRVWTGTTWSEVTRAYGDHPDASTLRSSLALLGALRRVLNVGVLGVVGGLGLLVSVIAHWPGSAQPAPAWFVQVASGAALALMAVGSVVCAGAVRELRGRWTIDAVIPGVNFLVVGVLVAQRVGRPSYLRLTAEVVMLVIFVTSSRADPWLGFAPVVVAFGQSAWLSALITQLSGAPTGDEHLVG